MNFVQQLNILNFLIVIPIILWYIPISVKMDKVTLQSSVE